MVITKFARPMIVTAACQLRPARIMYEASMYVGMHTAMPTHNAARFRFVHVRFSGGMGASVVTPKLVNRRSVTISPSCKRLRPDLTGAEHARRSGRYGLPYGRFQRGRKVKEGRRWLMNLGVTTLGLRCRGRMR